MFGIFPNHVLGFAAFVLVFPFSRSFDNVNELTLCDEDTDFIEYRMFDYATKLVLDRMSSFIKSTTHSIVLDFFFVR